MRLSGSRAYSGQWTSAGVSPLALKVRYLCHSNSSYSKYVCSAMTSYALLFGMLAPARRMLEPPTMSGSVRWTARRFRTLSPCGFQDVLRDTQRPCSITTVRFQLSETTVASTCRDNTLIKRRYCEPEKRPHRALRAKPASGGLGGRPPRRYCEPQRAGPKGQR